jgi:AspT/YidE/YbjL antiporter-like protein
MVTWVFPTLMKWDIRAEAIALEEKNSNGKRDLAPGEFNAVTALVTRAFKVSKDGGLAGKTLAQLNQHALAACIELIQRDGKVLEVDKFTALKEGDVIVVTGRRNAVHKLQDGLADNEIALPEGYEVIEENRQLIADNRKLIGKSLQEIKEASNQGSMRGIYVTDYIREGSSIEMTPDLVVKKNDVIQLTGTAKDINRVEKNIGQRMGSANVTDLVVLGMGMVVGLLIGLISFKIAGIPVTIGSGAGCLISGLIVGWLRSRNPHVAQFPVGAANFVRDFGLAAFVGIVGLEAGPQAVDTIKEHGMSLLFLGMGVTIIPQIISFFFSYFVLKIKNPVEALGCVTGGRSANPAFAALMEKTGNATPVFSFTVTYAVANVLLTLWGPIIVGIITLNAGM